MKKNIRAVMMFAAIALIAGVNVLNSQKTIAMSDIALANIEALADGEDGNERCLWDIAYMVCAPFGEYTHCYCGL